ncbi:hypothetical protein Rsub_04181 [Raphidocelis subcapitata]|uniref:Uncharacterized protein n=1 Tax=Raphidocelis subcapitata TaxID=307507 RepID=A0A2V0NUZ7_9CHLO|nr:hypothetical protein Rsub_04181 [Raphidocelis subcapitata]|eukprot:GBF91441.1 hypothetical protein Rsub_04181 [Raphidocelis subcapitata]
MLATAPCAAACTPSRRGGRCHRRLWTPPRTAAHGQHAAADGDKQQQPDQPPPPPATAAAAGSDPAPPSPAAAPPPTPPGGFTPYWPSNYRKRLEAATLERAHEADVTPTVFDFALWRRHRSRLRYVEHLVTLTGSYFVLDLAAPVIVLTAAAAAVGLYETVLQGGMLPSFLPNIAMAAEGPFNAASFAMSLMLAFKTNVSYARWNEARCLWGSLVNRSRNLVRQGLMLIPREHAALKPVLARWSIAFARALKTHLREDGDVAGELAAILEPHEVAVVAANLNRPLACLQAMSAVVRAARLDPIGTSRLDINLETFEDIMGACERILKTPIPLSYTRHTSRFLTLWLATLPFVLWNHIHWGVIPSTAVISFLLFGIDEIAIQLEEPFGILPLEAICDTIQRNIEELVNSEGAVALALDASMHEARARLAQEEELARMLEEQLPFNWGPRGLSQPHSPAAAPGTPGAAGGAGAAAAAAALIAANRPRPFQDFPAGQPATRIEPWREEPVGATAPPPVSEEGQPPQWRPGWGRGGDGFGQQPECPPNCSCRMAEPGAAGGQQHSSPALRREDADRLRRALGEVAARRAAQSEARAAPLEPVEMPWYADDVASDSLLGAAAAEADPREAGVVEFLLGRAHGANAVRHPGTPMGTHEEEEEGPAAAGPAPPAGG